MPPKRMSYKLRLHAASHKSPCTSSKRLLPKSDHISFLPDSPDSLDSKDQPKSNSDLCSDRLDNHPYSLFHQEQSNEDYFSVCEIALDSPRSLTLSQESDGKSDQDFLKEFNLSPCSVVLHRRDLFSEESTKKSDKNLLVENNIYQSYVKLERLKKSVVNHWTHSLPHKHFKAQHSSNYVRKSVMMDCEYFLQHKKAEVNYGDFKRKLGSTFNSFKFEQFKGVAQKTVMVHKNQLDLRHRISELIKKRERALKQKKRVYYEKDSYVLLNKEDVSKVRPCEVDLGSEKDSYVLLNKEDVSKVRPCEVDLGSNCSLVSSSSVHRTCDLTSKEESIRKERHQIFYKENFYVFVPKGTDGGMCREAVERGKQCKVIPNLRCCSLSPYSMHRLFESINEGKKETRRTSCEEDSENISPRPDSMSRIPGSNYNEKSQCRRTSSNSPVSMSNISGSTNNEVQSTMQKRKIFYSDDHYVMVNHDDVNKIRTAVLDKPRQKRIKTVHNSDANLIEEAIKNARNCRVVLENLNLGLHTMPQKFIIRKGVKNGQKKRKDIENRTVLENLEYVPLSLNKNSISRLRDSTCEKADLGLKRRKSSGNEYCVFVNSQCYSTFRMAVQNMEHCNVALDSNIGFFRTKETVLPPNSVTVPPANSVAVPPANSVAVPLANSVAVPPADSVAVPPADSVAVPPANSVAVPPANSVAVSPANSVAVSHANSVAVPPANAVAVSPANSVAVPPSTHRDITSFINTHENCPDLVSSQLSNSSRNKFFSNTEHNSQNFLLDQYSLSSSSCNFSSDFRTTFSGVLTDHGSLESNHEDSPQDVNVVDQNSFSLTLNTPLLSPTHSTCPQSTNESMLPESQRTCPQSTNESMLPGSQRTYPSSTTELSSSLQTCVTQELLVNQNSEKSIVAQYSSSQETCTQNIQNLTPTCVQCSPLPTNENCSQALFVENQNSPTQHSILWSSKPCVPTQNSTLSTNKNDSQELFGNLDSPTPCSISGSLEPCDSTQSSDESSESDHLTPAHVTKQDSPNACSPSASPNPYSLTHNSSALIVSDALRSCVTRPESPNACNSSASPNPNSLTLTTSGALTPAHVTIQDNTDACSTSASPNPYSLTLNSPVLTVSGALTSCVTKPESPNACNCSASPNPNSLTLTTSGALTASYVTIQDSPDAASPNPYSLTQSSPALTVSGALTSCVTNECDSSAPPIPNSLTLSTSGALTPAHLTLQDSPDTCSTSTSPNPYSLTQNSPALTVSDALTSCVTKPESPDARNSSASPNPNSLTLTTSGALQPAHVTIHDSPDACSTSASPNPYSLTQNSPALTVSGALTSCVTNACNSSASPNPNSLILTTSGALTPAHVTIEDSPDACSTSVSPNPYSLNQNSPALTVNGALTSCVTRLESPNACNCSASPNPKHFGTPNASSTSTAMDTDTEVDDEQTDSNVGRFKMDIALEALDFSAHNGNGEAQEIPNVTEHENLVTVRTNGVVKDLDSSIEEMDYSTDVEEDCTLQFDRKSGIKLVTNGLWNGGISGIDSDHSSSNTVITNKRTDDLGEWHMSAFTNNDR